MKQATQTLSLFDRFSLVIPTELKCHQDGSDGRRVLFLTNRTRSFVISFEEGMQLLDMLPTQSNTLCFQCCKDGKYLHLRRDVTDNHAFFHLELENAEGGTVYLPGQMTVSTGYQWSDGIEPILLELLEGITLL